MSVISAYWATDPLAALTLSRGLVFAAFAFFLLLGFGMRAGRGR